MWKSSNAYVLLVLGCFCCQSMADGFGGRSEEIAQKMDDGLPGADAARIPVFVRMKDQLFSRGGDYESFTRSHDGDDRESLRRTVLAALRSKSDDSWNRVRTDVNRLMKKGEIQGLQRYWIVNGFAAAITGKACRELAALNEVEFIYRQKGIARQHKITSPAAKLRAATSGVERAVYEKLLEDWIDDAREPFSTDGLTIPWNIKKIKANLVWEQEKTYGQGVVVALQDTGLMAVPALTHTLAKPKGETGRSGRRRERIRRRCLRVRFRKK